MKAPRCHQKRLRRRFHSTENALRVSELRYRRLFETAPDGILIIDAQSGRIEEINPFLTGLLGFSREQWLGNKLWEVQPFKEVAVARTMFKELPRKSFVRFDNLSLHTHAGKTITVEFVSNIYDVDGHRVVQCNIRDVTKRRQAEKQLEGYSQKLQALSRRLVEVQETERRNIARELHDKIGQSLTVIQLNLQALLQAPRRRDRSRLQESLGEVERVLALARDLALNLRPSILDDLGLETALYSLIKRQAALAGWQARFHSDPLHRRLNLVTETECFRVAQEALTNIARHARAKTVSVELRKEAGRLSLRIRDDGMGFDVRAVREKALHGASLGLLNMEERAALAGGALKVRSVPGGGTEVHAWFPLKKRLPLPEDSSV